jgi:uncharacterized membrane protein
VGERTIRRAGVALAALGIAIATYITIADAGGGAPACIAGGHGCQTVADSSYAHLGGVAVSVIGIVGYVAIGVAMLWSGDPGRFAGLALTLVGFAFSVYLTYVELAVIDAICQWCVASAVVMTALFALSVVRAVRFTGTELAVNEPHG